MTPDNPYETPSSNPLQEDSSGIDTSHPLSASGRFSRLSYLAWSLVIMIPLLLILAIMLGMVGYSAETGGSEIGINLLLFMIGVAAIAFIYLGIVIGIRRLHDLDKTGWFMLVHFIPVANMVLTVYLILAPGTQLTNRYAPPRETRTWEKILGSIMTVIMGLYIAFILLSLIAGI